MTHASHALVLLASLAVLVRSADRLVELGSRVARRLGVSDLTIGLLLTSVGTSVPELASSVAASLKDRPGIIVGNVIGSNVANIGLIAGVSTLVRPLATEVKMHERDGLILLAASVAFFAMALDNLIGSQEAMFLLAFYAIYVAFVARTDRNRIAHQFRYFLRFAFSLESIRPLFRIGKERSGRSRDPGTGVGTARRLAIELSAVIGYLAALAVSANFLIREASWTASTLGVPDSIVGLTVVAIGTSLPELVVALAAARRNNAAMVVGNVIGSNLANILLIVGISALIRPIAVAETSATLTIPILLFFTLGLLRSIKGTGEVPRWHGAVAVLAYAGFLWLSIWKR